MNLAVASKKHLEPEKRALQSQRYLVVSHAFILTISCGCCLYSVYDSRWSPAFTIGVTSLGGQQVEWLSNTSASRWHGTGASDSQHFVSSLRQPPTALWDCLPSHAFSTSLRLTPVSRDCAELSCRPTSGDSSSHFYLLGRPAASHFFLSLLLSI